MRVESAATYWSTGSAQFASRDGHQTYAVLRLAGADDAARIKSFDAVKNKLSAPGLTEQAGGQLLGDAPGAAVVNRTADVAGPAHGVAAGD